MKIDKRILFILGIAYLTLLLGILAFYLVNPFKNECVSGNCFNGKGVYIYNSGMKYEGEWKNGLRQGKGTLTYPNIYTYTGEWKNNRMDGHGTMEYYWYRYSGNWKEGKKSGKGIMWSFGRKYDGDWENDLMHGQGILFSNRTGNRYDVQMKNGTIYGKIKVTYPDGSIFVGEFMNNDIYARGTIIYPDGKKENKKLGKENFIFEQL